MKQTIFRKAIPTTYVSELYIYTNKNYVYIIAKTILQISQIEAICYGKKPGKNIDMLMCWPEGKEFKNEDFEKVNKWVRIGKFFYLR